MIASLTLVADYVDQQIADTSLEPALARKTLPASGRAHCAVSYTHLDVYKRQGPLRASSAPCDPEPGRLSLRGAGLPDREGTGGGEREAVLGDRRQVLEAGHLARLGVVLRVGRSVREVQHGPSVPPRARNAIVR